MTPSDAFLELFGRMPDLVREAVGSLDERQLARRIDPEANTIAWLVWHLARVEDDHISGAAAALGRQDLAAQAFTTEHYYERFGLPFSPEVHGFGMSVGDVGRVHAPAELLISYYQAVHDKTVRFLSELLDSDWQRVVDDAWDPPVTLLARIASVAVEVAQHVGQAALIRGVLEREPDDERGGDDL